MDKSLILKKIILISLFFNILITYAQKEVISGCGTDEIHLKQLEQKSTYQTKFEENNLKWQEYALNNAEKSQNKIFPTSGVTLSVAFHDLSETGSTYLLPSSSNIDNYQYILNALDDYFNPTSNQSDPNNTLINFCLAKKDKKGDVYTFDQSRKISPFSGNLDKSDPSQIIELAYDAISDTATDFDNRLHPTTKYINIYIVDNIFGPVAAFAYMPSSHGNDTDGIYIERSWLDNVNLTNDIKVLVHEMGHYLGLFHTFQYTFTQTNVSGCDVNYNCLNDGDMVCDTPPHLNPIDFGINYDSNCTPDVSNTCNETIPTITDGTHFNGDADDPTSNFMNYSQRSCKIEFTEGQILRMRFMVDPDDGPRKSLLGQAECENCVSLNGCVFSINTSVALDDSRHYIEQGNNVFFTGSNDCNNNNITYSWELFLLNNDNTSTLTTFSNQNTSGLGVGNYHLVLNATDTVEPLCSETSEYFFSIIPQAGNCNLVIPASNNDWDNTADPTNWTIISYENNEWFGPGVADTTPDTDGFEIYNVNTSDIFSDVISSPNYDPNFATLPMSPSTGVDRIMRVGRIYETNGNSSGGGRAHYAQTTINITNDNCKYRIWYLGGNQGSNVSDIKPLFYNNNQGNNESAFGWLCEYDYNSIINTSSNTVIGSSYNNGSNSNIYRINDLISRRTNETSANYTEIDNFFRANHWQFRDVDFSEFVNLNPDTEITLTFFEHSNYGGNSQHSAYSYFGIECLGGGMPENFSLNIDDISLPCITSSDNNKVKIKLPIPAYLPKNQVSIFAAQTTIYNFIKVKLELKNPIGNSFSNYTSTTSSDVNNDLYLRFSINPNDSNYSSTYRDFRVTYTTLHGVYTDEFRVFLGFNNTDALCSDGGVIDNTFYEPNLINGDILICNDSILEGDDNIGNSGFPIELRLTSNCLTANFPNVDFHYQWFKGAIPIPGETDEVLELDYNPNRFTLPKTEFTRKTIYTDPYCGTERSITSEKFKFYNLNSTTITYDTVITENICYSNTNTDRIVIDISNLRLTRTAVAEIPDHFSIVNSNSNFNSNNQFSFQLMNTQTNDLIGYPIDYVFDNQVIGEHVIGDLHFDFPNQDPNDSALPLFVPTESGQEFAVRLTISGAYGGCDISLNRDLTDVIMTPTALGGEILFNCNDNIINNDNAVVNWSLGNQYGWEYEDSLGSFISIPSAPSTEELPIISSYLTLANPLKIRRVAFDANDCRGNVIPYIPEYSNVVTVIPPPTLQLDETSGSTCGLTPITISNNTFGGSVTALNITENGAGTASLSTTNNSFEFTYIPNISDFGTTVIITITTENPASCNVVSVDYTLTVNAGGDSSFSYPTSVCIGKTNPVATNYSAGGIFSVNNNATVDQVTGELNLSGILPSEYEITYTVTGNCSSTTTHTIVVYEDNVISISYNDLYCNGDTNPLPIIQTTNSSIPNGEFSIFDNGIEVNNMIDPITGEIDLDAGSLGSLQVIYKTCGNTFEFLVEIESCNNQCEVTLFEYPKNIYCLNDANQMPVIENTGTLSTSNTFVVVDANNFVVLDLVDENTGEINFNNNYTGVFTITYYACGSSYSFSVMINSCSNNQDYFVTTWEIDNSVIFDSPNGYIKIPTEGTGYNYDVDWDDDGVFDEFGFTGDATYNYGLGGNRIRTIRIRGDFPRIYFQKNNSDRYKIKSVDQWGAINWKSMQGAFKSCHNLKVLATDAPDLSEVEDMSSMFEMCSSLNDDIGHWNTSNVTNMKSLFNRAETFNQYIGEWVTTNVTDMSFMFMAAIAFDKDLSLWNTENVTDMSYMFASAEHFNQDIIEWNTRSVTNMSYMFSGAISFNNDIDDWQTFHVENMSGMFNNAISFNAAIRDINTENVTDMSNMFSRATSFNQDINTWNTSRVTSMRSMFLDAPRFNQNIGGWDTGSVVGMTKMFMNAIRFKQNLGSWNVTSLQIASRMFEGVDINEAGNTDNYDNLLIGWNNQNLKPNVIFHGGNSKYCLGETARQNMESAPDSWIITDGGLDSNCTPTLSLDDFVTTWKTDNPGSSNATSITIPTIGNGYNYDVDWNNDGTFEETGLTGSVTHEFAVAGNHTIRIKGDFPRIHFNNTGDKDKILSIDQWGIIEWKSMHKAFYGCSNLVELAIDAPDLSQVTDMSYMFTRCYSLNQPLDNWDTTNIRNMRNMFDSTYSFNQNINYWVTSNVTNMSKVFNKAYSFNQNISNWVTTNVTDMHFMFNKATVFNQNIGNWNTSNVTNMVNMFANATSFNQDISEWDTSSVLFMAAMFFESASFNQDISGWNTSNVIEMKNMFERAFDFDQNLGSWNVENVTNMMEMFQGVTLSTDNYDATLIGWNNQNLRPNVIFDGGNSKYCLGETARQNMESAPDSWIITDGGLDSNCTPTLSLDDFVTTWKTDNPGSSNATSITIQTIGNGYNYDVDWDNDGNFEETGLTGSVTHEFAIAGKHTIRIKGDFPRIHFNNTGDKDKILSIDQWGTIGWKSMRKAFYGCSNLKELATDAPDLSQVTDMLYMFIKCTSLNQPLENWDTSNVENMEGVFFKASSFNQDIGYWDTSKVTNMGSMFNGATAFNQDISSWITSRVKSMGGMFNAATSFNQNIGNWNTTNVTKMNYMFSAGNFNKDIGGWNTSRVENMQGMFFRNPSFNQNIGTWNVLSVTNMLNMFYGASSFNQNIGAWNTSSVINMRGMFGGAVSFNQNIGDWNTSRVTNMSYMFNYANRFNQNICNWDTRNVTNMSFMFNHALDFDQNVGCWNVASVEDMKNMLQYVTLSTENYDATLIGWNDQDLQSGVDFHGGNSKYCLGETARQNMTMISSDNWSITDAGLDCRVRNSNLTNAEYENNKIVTFSIYPNPTSSKLNISALNVTGNIQLEIFSMLGEKIMLFELGVYDNGQLHQIIDVSDISSGSYFVRIKNGITLVQNSIFIKN